MLMRVLLLVLFALGLSANAGAQASSKQMEILRDAAAKGSAPAQYSLGTLAERSGDFAAALRLYRQAANAGYAGAQYSLALMLDAGLGTAPDPIEAERLLQRAAAANFEPALQQLVRMERARAEASKSASSSAPAVALPTAQATPGSAGRLAWSSWGLAAGTLLLAAAAFYWIWNRRAPSPQATRRSQQAPRRRR